MKYYLNFIFIILFIQLLVVQTKDPVLKTFHQKLWNKRNQTKVLYIPRFSTKSKSPVFHSDTFYNRFYSKAQTLRSATVIPTFHTINKRDTDGCYSKNSFHGNACARSIIEKLFGSLLLLLLVCGFLWRFCSCLHPHPQVHSTSRSIIEQPQTLNRSNFVPINSVTQSSSDMQNSNLRHSTETQLLLYNNCRIERALSTSSLPPAYSVVMRENSVTISEEHQSMLPPSYNDFMRRINKTDL